MMWIVLIFLFFMLLGVLEIMKDIKKKLANDEKMMERLDLLIKDIREMKQR